MVAPISTKPGRRRDNESGIRTALALFEFRTFREISGILKIVQKWSFSTLGDSCGAPYGIFQIFFRPRLLALRSSIIRIFRNVEIVPDKGTSPQSGGSDLKNFSEKNISNSL